MAIEQTKLESILSNSFPGADIEIRDLVGDQDHYSLVITSEQFNGKSRIEQHKMVNNALKDCLHKELHAIQIKTQIKES